MCVHPAHYNIHAHNDANVLCRTKFIVFKGYFSIPNIEKVHSCHIRVCKDVKLDCFIPEHYLVYQ